jgi:hypothetical protein
MKLGIMQPYFFPYLGYFDVIHCAEEWIVADLVQYIRHGWVNRNRILHPATGWQYITVPVRKHALETPIRDIAIADTDWRTPILRHLDHYRTRAPHFAAVFALVERGLARPEPSLARLNTALLADVCAYLGLPFRYRYLSEMNLALGPIERPADWALRICEAVGAHEYVNPPGGAALYDPAEFARHGLALNLRPLIDFRYACGPYTFVPHLSIVDVLMWNAPETVRRHLDAIRAEGGKP